MRSYFVLLLVSLLLVEAMCAPQRRGGYGGRGRRQRNQFTAYGRGEGEAEGRGIRFGRAKGGRNSMGTGIEVDEGYANGVGEGWAGR